MSRFRRINNIGNTLILAGLAACGGGGEGDRSDGGSPAPPDAMRGDPPVDALEGADADPRGTITMVARTIDGRALPDPSTLIVVQDRERTQTITPDAAGAATAAITSGATVTAVRRWPHERIVASLVTIFGVESGDALQFGSPAWASPAAGTMTLEHPVVQGATTYRVNNGCSETDSPGGIVTVPFDAACGAGPHDIHVAVFQDNALLATATVLDVPFVAGGGPIRVGSFVSPVTFTARYANLPTGLTRIDARRTSVHEGKTYLRRIGNVAPVGSAATVSYGTTDFGDRMEVQSSLSRSVGIAATRQIVTEEVPRAAAYQLDVAGLLMPWIDNVAFDEATDTVSWNLTAGRAADGMIIRITYQSADQKLHQWRLVAPSGTTRITLPVLTPELEELELLTMRPRTITISAIDLANITSYDAFRPIAELDGFGEGGAAGRVIVSDATLHIQ